MRHQASSSAFSIFIDLSTAWLKDLITNFNLFYYDRPVSRVSAPIFFPQKSIAPVPTAAGDDLLESQIPASTFNHNMC